jgi:hypothetical protein
VRLQRVQVRTAGQTVGCSRVERGRGAKSRAGAGVIRWAEEARGRGRRAIGSPLGREGGERRGKIGIELRMMGIHGVDVVGQVNVGV